LFRTGTLLFSGENRPGHDPGATRARPRRDAACFRSKEGQKHFKFKR
jgi:hypothetical protein